MTVPAVRARRRASGQFVRRLGSGVENPLVVGERGAGLARMHRLGLPVPSGFVLTTDAWRAWQRSGREMSVELLREFRMELLQLIADVSAEQPQGAPALLVVRPAPPARVAHAAGTVLGLGLDLAPEPGRARSQRLLLQVRSAVETIWRAWDAERAYADLPISPPRERGTAVVVQRLIWSEPSERSGHGRLLTRDPDSGLPGAVGCFKAAAAQGSKGELHDGSLARLRLSAPAAYAALSDGGVLMESAYRDMCEIEFLLDRGSLWMLDARPAQRSAAATIRVAVDLVEEGMIELDEALGRISLPALDRLQRAQLERGQTAGAPQLARLLMWLEERRKVAVTDRAPRGWPTVGTRQQALALDGAGAVIDLSVIAGSLRSVVRTALARGVGGLALRLPDAPLERDLKLPPAPWRSIVTAPEHSWAARLLAARAQISSGAQDGSVLLEKPTTS